MMKDNEVNMELIRQEVEAAFNAYEAALVANDTEMLDKMFWKSALTVRYGVSENLYGIEEIRAFRKSRSAAGLDRLLSNTRVTTFGRDFAVTNTEFLREGQPVGRQSQTWARFQDGWRVISAHVSYMSRPS